jgi:hypothetical protein
MATYCYSTDDGETVERQFPLGKAPRTVSVERGKGQWVLAHRDFRAEHGQRSSLGDLYPTISVSMGVHPNEIEQTKRQLAAAGIPTEFDARGNAKIESYSHRKKLMKHVGMVDKDTYTGF